jgi:transposase
LRDIQLATHQGNLALANLINRTEFLRKELLSINREIKRLAKEEKFLKQIGLLTRIPGIGTLTALIIIAIIEDINRFKRSDDFFSFIGLVPSTNRTGDNEKTGDITPRRNKILRGIIVESSWIAVRYDPALMLAFADLCKRMEKSKAIIRIAKKLLNRIRYVLKEQKEYAYNVAA